MADLNRQQFTDAELFAKEKEIQSRNLFFIHNHGELVDVRKDYAEVQLRLVPESMNFLGTVHGGAHFTLADVCAGIVCRTDGRKYVTQHASVEYIRAVKGGVLSAKGSVMHRGRTGCVVEIRIFSEEGKLAFAGTFQFACIG